jgi:hypothetical protein
MHAAAAVAADTSALLRLEEGRIAVYEGDVPAARPRGALTPVYSLDPRGRLAVPTGRIFLRLRDSARMVERRAAIESAGYRVDEIPAYAPQAAWLTSRTGDIADALGRLGLLEALADVENVEPQMLLEASRR